MTGGGGRAFKATDVVGVAGSGGLAANVITADKDTTVLGDVGLTRQ